MTNKIRKSTQHVFAPPLRFAKDDSHGRLEPISRGGQQALKPQIYSEADRTYWDLLSVYNAARDQLMTKASLVRPFKKVSSGVTSRVDPKS